MPDSSCPRFLAVDLFCGAGGTTRGLIDAGGYVIAGVDNDARCEATYLYNNPNECGSKTPPEFLCRDLFAPEDAGPARPTNDPVAEELSTLARHARGAYPSAPLLLSITAPCQPFTKISKKALSESRVQKRERDQELLINSLRFVSALQPELVFAENVAGITEERYGGVWQAFMEGLERLGFVIGSRIVCASNFGIPQFRKRTILLGVQRSLVRPERFGDVLRSSLLVPARDPQFPMKSVREAISHLPKIDAGAHDSTIPNHRARSLSDLNKQRLSVAKPGQSNVYLEQSGGTNLTLSCNIRVNAKLQTRCFTDVYTRMHPDRPSPTITTKCHSISNGRFGHYDTTQLRGISLREAALLQSFPDDYVFLPEHQIDPIARMIGNAVPPRLAAFFARYLIESVKFRPATLATYSDGAGETSANRPCIEARQG